MCCRGSCDSHGQESLNSKQALDNAAEGSSAVALDAEGDHERWRLEA
jgi:hypothetical protein